MEGKLNNKAEKTKNWKLNKKSQEISWADFLVGTNDYELRLYVDGQPTGFNSDEEDAKLAREIMYDYDDLLEDLDD